jgi:hypothetical protein
MKAPWSKAKLQAGLKTALLAPSRSFLLHRKRQDAPGINFVSRPMGMSSSPGTIKVKFQCGLSLGSAIIYVSLNYSLLQMQFLI